MIPDLELAILLLVTVFGALTDAVLGWKDGGGDFDIKKFWPSIVRAVVAAALIFVANYTGYITGSATIITYVAAFLVGMGLNSAVNKVSGVIRPAKT